MAEDSGLREGDCFGVPLPGGGFGVGVAARLGPPGLVLGYFSPMRFAEPPLARDSEFSADSALWIKLFGDLGFLERRWPILGAMHNWNPDEWPLPDFSHHEELTGRSYRITYRGDLRNRPDQVPARPEDLVGLPEQGIAGAKFVELKLDRMLAG